LESLTFFNDFFEKYYDEMNIQDFIQINKAFKEVIGFKKDIIVNKIMKNMQELQQLSLNDLISLLDIVEDIAFKSK